MNDHDLRRQFQRLPVPRASATARARARHRALLAFQQPAPSARPSSASFAWLLRGAITLLVIAAIVSAYFLGRHDKSEDVAADLQVLHQVGQLFPRQVNAVIEVHGKVDLSIAQSPVVGSDQPVVLVFQHGSEAVRVLSYSGHHLCVNLGGKLNCFDILATPDGGVILEGENQAWLASDRPEISGYTFHGQSLGASL